MKSKIIGRKQILGFIIVASLGLAVFVNWYYTNPKSESQAPTKAQEEVNLGDAQYVNASSVQETDYFTNARLNRTKAHDSAKEHLESLISNVDIDDETKVIAQNELIELSNLIKNEADIENLIKSQVNGECIVTLSSDKVEIVLPKSVTDEDTVVKIKDIIISKTKLNADDITIIEYGNDN